MNQQSTRTENALFLLFLLILRFVTSASHTNIQPPPLLARRKSPIRKIKTACPDAITPRDILHRGQTWLLRFQDGFQTLHHTPILAATTKSSIFKPSLLMMSLPSFARFPRFPPPAFSWPRLRSKGSLASVSAARRSGNWDDGRGDMSDPRSSLELFAVGNVWSGRAFGRLSSLLSCERYLRCCFIFVLILDILARFEVAGFSEGTVLVGDVLPGEETSETLWDILPATALNLSLSNIFRLGRLNRNSETSTVAFGCENPEDVDEIGRGRVCFRERDRPAPPVENLQVPFQGLVKQ